MNNTAIINEPLDSNILSEDKYTIDDFIERALKIKELGYTHIEIEAEEYNLSIRVSRPKTEEDFRKEAKNKADRDALYKKQQFHLYKKLREEFGALPDEEI